MVQIKKPRDKTKNGEPKIRNIGQTIPSSEHAKTGAGSKKRKNASFFISYKVNNTL